MSVFRGYGLIVGITLLMASGSIFLSAFLFARLSDQQDAINRNRYEVVLDNCRQQNARNKATKRKLTLVVAALKDPRQRARANRNIAGTIALIDALAPRQRNCRAYVERTLNH